MKKVVWVRRAHKWLALAAGIQVSIWAVSGLYMTVIDLDIIHGNHLVSEYTEPKFDRSRIKPITNELLESLAPVQSIKLTSYFGAPVYEITAGRQKTVVVDALTGQLKEDLNKPQIEQNAAAIYAGDAAVKTIRKLAEYPGEIGGSKMPVWQVQYDDVYRSTLYFHHSSGRLVSKRSDLWRVFDVFWILHIMDYMGSNGHRGYLFRFFSISSLLLAIFGTWLLFYRLRGVAAK